MGNEDRAMVPVPATAEEMKARVEEQLAAIPWPAAVEEIRRHLVEPELHWRRWEYGREEELPCWLVASWPEQGWGTAYCALAHAYDWGWVDLKNLWFGMDSYWNGTLLEATPPWSRELEGWYEWLLRQPTWQHGVLHPPDPDDFQAAGTKARPSPVQPEMNRAMAKLVRDGGC